MEKMKKRLDVQISATSYDYIKEQSEQTGYPMNVIADELLSEAIARKRGEVIEQQSLPIIRDIVQSELRKAMAQQRQDLREDLDTGLLPEIKLLQRASDNRLAALIVKAVRDSAICRRMLYALTSKTHGADFASRAYNDALEKAGKELANREQ